MVRMVSSKPRPWPMASWQVLEPAPPLVIQNQIDALEGDDGIAADEARVGAER